MTTVTLIGRDGCHLCDVARGVIDHVLADLPDDQADAVTVEELSIQDDPALSELWWEKIPVVLIDGDLHAHWRLDAARLSAALRGADAASRAQEVSR
ncbi:MAG: glutaredoxin family protein [Actinomycetota bacterium]|nr:glutaredoxin family protein [Actinomycetota bacterium]